MSQVYDKSQLLKNIYSIYNQLTNNWKLACRKGCSDCCTDRILMTSLEGMLINEYLKTNKLQESLQLIHRIPLEKRYHPKTTINQEAILALQNKPIPEPEEVPLKSCIFLTKKQCSIYPVRPMACRTMVSSLSCHKTGHASMTSFQMSVATLFYQFVEMLDTNGFYGNYLNILEMLTLSPETQSLQLILIKSSLLKNQRIHQVMMPPEHQEKLIPIMDTIQYIFKMKA